MINFGIIGFGKMGQIRAQALEASKGAMLKTVYEENTLSKTISYAVAENADEIINDQDIDVVY